jgi:Protein of unknown function (DUF2474)
VTDCRRCLAFRYQERRAEEHKREIMFGLTAPELARTQFGFTIAFHIIFLAVTIWALSMLALGAVAGLFRIMMACAGLTL